MVARSPDANGQAAPEMTDVSVTAPEAGRKLFVIMRTPDEPLLAQLRGLGWEIAVAKTAGAAQNMTSGVNVAAGLVDFTGFTSRDYPALKACLSQPAIGWISIAQAGITIGPAVRELIRSYCFDYVTLPLPYEWISHVLGHARGMAALDRVDGAAYAASIGEHGMIGNCEAMQQLFSTIRKVAKTDASVFISGESGTGKELTALAIHERSVRGKGPFVAINCGAIPHHLLQSELFGYERGAFTGANQRRAGRIESANGGTLFLDEIGDVPLPMQVKLLRLIESGTFRRVGGVEALRADFRLLAATHKPLREMIDDGRFRQDLYYRINAFPIPLPALRDRQGDVALLAESILRRIANARGKAGDASARPFVLTERARACLDAYAWPGNIRELRNVLERACLFADDGTIRVEHLPAELVAAAAAPQDRAADARGVSDAELVRIARTFDGTRKALAAQLGLSERTLYRRMKALGLGTRDR